MTKRQYGIVAAATPNPDLAWLALYFRPLMQRNVATDGFVFTDPADPTRFSLPGCILASPSYELNLGSIRQNYVYNWTRDAAVTAIEIALGHDPLAPGAGSGPLSDYVAFAAVCQANTPTLARGSYTIEGQPRDWTDQNDGPALQVLAVLAAFDQLDAAAQQTALEVADRDVEFLLAHYQEPSYNLWEETKGQSFFTRAVQLRCLEAVAANTIGIATPPGIAAAVGWLAAALETHWNGDYYVSILDPADPRPGYDPNIDIVMASVYGAIDPLDPKLLATAAKLRRQWADPSSPACYPINVSDAARGIGPLVGRYPGDVYDGDNNDSGTSHPWALCTANVAEHYYRVATAVEAAGSVPVDDLTADFFALVGANASTPAEDAAAMLRAAGDAMLQAVVFHSDHLELSEQFDGTTGFEKSVRNLTWSYAAFLSALRARG